MAEEALGHPTPADFLKKVIACANFHDDTTEDSNSNGEWQFGAMAGDEDFRYLEDESDEASMSIASVQR